MEIFALSTTMDEAHAVLPKGKFNVNDWSYEEGINLGKSEIGFAEAEKLAPGTWRIERATWGAYVSWPGYSARWIKLTVEQAS